MLFEKIIPSAGCSFSKRNFVLKAFPTNWHYHPEFELILISQGYGKRFVGNCVTDFKDGEIVLIGENVPHFHMSDIAFNENNDMFCFSEVIQFRREVFPESMESMMEFDKISRLFERSKKGVLFKDEGVVREVRRAFASFESLKGLDALVELYRILHVLGKSSYDYLSSAEYDHQYLQYKDNTPVQRTYQFVMNNFKEQITLQEIADYAGQNRTALCRNFKQNTGKTIFNFLLDVRVEFAYKLLKNSDFNITQIAFESGFCNISHFNNKFKEISGLTPTEYRKIHKK